MSRSTPLSRGQESTPPFPREAPSPLRPAGCGGRFNLPPSTESLGVRRVGDPVARAAASIFSSRPSLSSPHPSSASHGREEEAPPQPVVDLRSPQSEHRLTSSRTRLHFVENRRPLSCARVHRSPFLLRQGPSET